MNKIYADANEKLVNTIVVYADADDGHLFVDEAKKTKLTKDAMKNLFLKGILTIVLNDSYLKPTVYKVSGKGATVSVYNTDKVSTFKSAEVE